MLSLYAKAKQKNAPAHILKRLNEAFEHDEETAGVRWPDSRLSVTSGRRFWTV